MKFDNSSVNSDHHKKYGIHFSFTLNDKKIIYCYIRKNACSSFKDMIAACSPHKSELANFPTKLRFLNQYHSTREKQLDGYDHSIFVVRDPFERIVSVYKNKFIQRKGNADIFSSYAKLTDRDPDTASFEDLVAYCENRSVSTLDPHLHTQSSHLLPAVYSDAIPIGELHRRMTEIAGGELADRYFLRKSNSTATLKSVAVEGAWSIPSRELHALYRDREVLPETASFLPAALQSRIRAIYADDVKLYDTIRTSSMAPVG